MLWHVKGGDGQHRYIPASWQTLDRAPGGALRFQETDAWFDVLSCKAYEARRLEALARPVAGGLAYAFRTRCPSCKGSKIETLHLLTPSAGFDLDTFAHHEIALGPGLSSSKVIALSLAAITRFRKAGAVTERATDARLGIEVMQASGEAEPTAVVYVSDTLHLAFEPEQPEIRISTQRRKDAKTQSQISISSLCAFAPLRLCVKFSSLLPDDQPYSQIIFWL